MTHDKLTGRTLGEFVIADRIGEGGFGAVYRARQPQLDREAVVKVLHARLLGADGATERFLREARLASRLDHPYAAHVYAFGAEHDGTLWIAMELVRGTTLSEYLRVNGPLGVERLIPLLDRICEVVHSAHEVGIVHRDIKPANVMVVARAGQLLPKLLDFGIAKASFETHEAGNAGGDNDAVYPVNLAIDDTIASAKIDDVPSSNGSTQLAMGDTVAGAGESRPSQLELRVDPTQRGTVMGSPQYMAPEQWADAAAVTPRTDLYALGILAYEALTGAPPFQGSTVGMLAAAHRHHAIPPLPSGLPRALDAVIARALAKRPTDRFASALELAAAFRAACLPDEKPPLPQLDETVRRQYLARAPQPLAEAIAALESARDARQARDALWVIPRVLVRWLSLLALVARSRTGAPDEGTTAVSAVRELATTVPGDDQWLKLAHALVRSHATQPDLHPIPELVLFLCKADDAPGDGVLAHRALVALHDKLEDPSAPDDVITERLRPALVLLADLLRHAAFVCAYPLVVPCGDGLADRWIGPRRLQRVRTPVLGDVDRGRPVLIDERGTPVLALYPLVQVADPAPGVAPELFLYVGRDPRGAKLAAPPSSFELHDQQVLEWLRAQMATTFVDLTPASTGERAPYLGLAAFTASDAALYVGREREIDAFINRLRIQPLLAVVGPSGAGKSSFVQAGVIPLLGAWRFIIVRPGLAPLVTLASQVRLAGIGDSELASTLAVDPPYLGELLRTDASRGPLLLVIDQFEELFTLVRDEDERAAFAMAIASAARVPDDQVRVVMTLRDDFLVAAQAFPDLRDRFVQGLQLLTTPSREDLERILVEPARRAGYEFEDPDLPARMIGQIADRPGALALLSFTAARLWDHRDRHFRRLPTKAYELLGGVAGALAQHAEALLTSASAHDQHAIREAFRHLVTAEGTRAVLTRSELAAVMGGIGSTGDVIERLVASRLLVAREGETDEQIEIAHEALIDAWPRLVQWREEDREGARLRDQLRTSARQWDTRGRPHGLLWRGDALVEYQLWRRHHPGRLGEIEESFAAASLRDDARGKRFRRSILVAVILALAAGLAIVLTLRQRADEAARNAERERERARLQLMESYEEQGRRALLEGEPRAALAYLNEAFQMGADSPALRFMIARALEPFEAEQTTLVGHRAQIWVAAFRGDGAQILTAAGDGDARTWDSRTGAPLLVLGGHAPGQLKAVWNPAGSRIATADASGHVRLWDARTGELVREVERHGGAEVGVAFSPDGRFMATWGDSIVRIWGADPLALVAEIDVGMTATSHLELGPSGDQFVVTGGTDAKVATMRGVLHHLAGHAGNVWYARYSPNGLRIATCSLDGTARIWDSQTGKELAILRGHEQRVTDLAWAPHGATLATISADRTTRLWDASTGELLKTLHGHAGQINRVRFSPDGSSLVTVAADGTARVWDAIEGTETGLFAHEGFVFDAALSPSGDRLVTASWDGSAKVWSLARQRRLATWRGPRAPRSRVFGGGDLVLRVERSTGTVWNTTTGTARTISTSRELRSGDLARDGSRVVLADAAGFLELLRADLSRLHEREAHPGGVGMATFDRSGRFIASAGRDGTIALWDGNTLAPLARRRVDPPIDTVSFSPDGTRVLGFVPLRPVVPIVFSRDGLAPIASLHGTGKDDKQGRPIRVAMSADGSQIATVTLEGTVRFFNQMGELLRVWSAGVELIAAEWDPRANRVFVGGFDGTVSIWSSEAGEHDRVKAHDNLVHAIAFAPDGSVFATAGDSTVKVWDSASHHQLFGFRTSESVVGIMFSADNTRLIVAGEDFLSVWAIAPSTRDRARLQDFLRCLRIALEAGRVRQLALPSDQRQCVFQ